MYINRCIISIVKPFIESFPRLAAVFRSVRDQYSFSDDPIATPWGFKMVGNSSMAQGTFEPVETEFIRDMLKDVDVLVNIGANIGYYCCHALSMGKRVIAFEPMQQNLRYLCKNIKINNWTNVEIYPVALSNSIGVLEIYGGGTGASILKGWAGAPESYVTLVPSTTLDVVLGTRLQGKKVLVLVDIEGAEKWMLEGAAIMLTNEPKPAWIVEITTKEHQPEGVEINPNLKSTFQIFFQNGYQACSFNQEARPISMEEVEQVSKGVFEFKTYNFCFQNKTEV